MSALKRKASEHFKTWGDVQSFMKTVQITKAEDPSKLNASLAALKALGIKV